MNRYERWNVLLEMVAEAGQLDVVETAEKLDVSTATIRRDFDELAAQQLLTRTRGGAIAHSVSYDLPLRYKVAQHAPEKQRIGSAAAALVPEGSTVGLNGGTTTTEVARALATRDLGGDQRGPALTVVTNALNIAHELVVRPHLHVVTTGGSARAQSYELVGPVATGMLERIALDVAVLGVDALDVDHGASAHNEGEAAINQLMAAKARQVIIVADGSKLGKRAFSRICPLAQIDVLVTDSTAPADLTARFAESGVRIVQV
ncbi:DeoR/GlpR family DNA-binding transcription regulator [Nonomuraea sp. NPDC050547]|uniref:DeoR family transcriptional regulator of aga operon n=1 Tax=Nonomuraea endophytica TaxID=714136 RepID=A0A7W8EFU9_9ACTN|nr:DeoR/GlpR family DNA-binding transcription regulator [Nonomuraea endophytica]MBB5077934.1 DeoR family transcriptional regulator of aga operon [Nonomuraea endophytica]